MRRYYLFLVSVCAGLALVSGSATADRIVAPFKCFVDRGALHVEAGPVRMYRIASKPVQRAFRICKPGGGAEACRTLIVHKLDIECAGGVAAWRDIAGRLIAARTRDIEIRNGHLAFQLREPSFGSLNPLCGREGGAHIDVSAAERHWNLDTSCREFGYVPMGRLVLPRGFAPLTEIGGRLLVDTAGPGPAAPPPPVRRPHHPVPAVLAQAGASGFPVVVASGAANTPKPLATVPPSVAPAPVAKAVPSEPSAIAQGEPRPHPLHAGIVSPGNRQQSGDAVSPAPTAQDASQPVTLNSWSTIVEVIRAGTAEGVSGEARRNAQQSLIATMLGLALLTSLFSGIGWIAGRQFWRPPDIRKVDPYQVMLRREVVDLAKPDAQMCGELCRSAQGLVGQIHAGVSELQGVAPLRRVLVREVRNMEKFLAATIGNEPSDPQEWRRMRLRLQRVVTDLMRLKDITDGAKRSLTTAVVTKELPKDKHEAFEVLGANPEASEKILKRLVDALRATWHPDHAVSEEDREAREERIKQINVAWDLIRDKRVEA